MNTNTKIVIIVILAVLGIGVFRMYKNSNTNTKTQINDLNNETKTTTEAKLISPQEFAQLATDPNTFILDVHTPEQTHIPGTDKFIPYDQIKENIGELPANKDTPILVYCRSGGMSAEASKELVALGYTHVYDLEGGTTAYMENEVSVALTPSTKSLGTVIYGDVATTKYTLTNYTPLPLKITKVSTSCGCTKAQIEKEVLGAYESTTVNVTFDPAVHKDDTDLGDLTRTIYVETDNPNFSELQSSFTAIVVKKD